MNYSLKEALKYQQRDRLTVAQIHPSLRFSRLGAVLREHAAAPDEVGALAHSALTADHSQPLPLTPIQMLSDYLQEYPDHSLAKEFNWERVPEGVRLDEALRPLIGDDPNELPDDVKDRLKADPQAHQIRKQHPIANSKLGHSVDGYTHSVHRLLKQRYHRRYNATDPEGLMTAMGNSDKTKVWVEPFERF